MASIQTSDEIQDNPGAPARSGDQHAPDSRDQLAEVDGVDALAADVVESSSVQDRVLTVRTRAHEILVDLQRTGRLAWLADARPHIMAAGSSRPTVRLLLVGWQGLDLAEPAKTKRITVTLSARV